MKQTTEQEIEELLYELPDMYANTVHRILTSLLSDEDEGQKFIEFLKTHDNLTTTDIEYYADELDGYKSKSWKYAGITK